jgi:ketosteroid isomerase-like protein
MSQQNVELVRRGMESAQAFWSLFDERVVFNMHGLVLDADDVYVGRDAAIEATRGYWGTFENYQLEALELVEAGSSVVVVVRERGRGRGSGAPFERRWAQVWTFRSGRLVRWEVFPDRAEALEAVGLAE